ncbi:MAG: 3-oxoacyl-[acyl-carrier-protein] reductase [Nitrospirota bacterium]
MKLQNDVAFVTGAAQGIGKAIALALAKEGACVIISDINFEAAEETSKEIDSSGNTSLALRLDVSDPKGIEDAFDVAIKKFGKIDILVNNAGITKDNLIIRMKEEEWDTVLAVNLKGTFLCTKAAVKTMSKQRYGRIINISSVVAFMGNAGQVNYVASKAAIVGFTKSVAREYASRGITVNAVAPGFIETAMTQVLPESLKEEMKRQIPIGRFGFPEDVANVVKFLSYKDSGYITGQVIHVNGGMYM